MSPKLYENHTIITKNWKNFMRKILFLLFILASYPIMLIGGIIWLISLGHFPLYRLGSGVWTPDKNDRYTFLGIDVTNIAWIDKDNG